MKLIMALLFISLIILTARADINCDDIPNVNLQLPGTNNALCQWTTSNDKQRILYEKELDNKASQLYIREEGKDNVVVSETAASVDWDYELNKWFIYKYDVLNGKELRLEINQSAMWPSGIQWELAPTDIMPDPERILLPLKTWDGIDFYSYYYMPTGKLRNCDGSIKESDQQKVIVLLQGGTGSYKYMPAECNSMGIETAQFLKEQGYLVLMANVRGKKKLSNLFRLTGIGHMYDNGTKDIIAALDALDAKYGIDKSDIKAMGCSRGGHMAALFATNLSDIDSRYHISKTIVSSGVLNNILGALNYLSPLPVGFQNVDIENSFEYDTDDYNLIYNSKLDFHDTDWMGGAICPARPHGAYTDLEWSKIIELDYTRSRKYLERYPELDQIVCKNQTYLNNNPAEKINKLQGELLALAGYEEWGSTSFLAPIEFQSRDQKSQVSSIIHPFGHCISPDNTIGFSFKKRIYSDFLNGCKEKITKQKIAGLQQKIDKAHACLKQYYVFPDSLPYSRLELETILSAYDSEYISCDRKINLENCQWQLFSNYQALFEEYKTLYSPPTECLEFID